jgi:hypothetical protein
MLRLIKRDLLLRAGCNLDRLQRVVELDGVAHRAIFQASLKYALGHEVGGNSGWRTIQSAPQASDDVGVAMIVLVERYEHFVIDLGNPQKAAPGPAADANHPRPGIQVRKGGNVHLYPAFGKNVEVAGHHAGSNSKTGFFFLGSGKPFQ